MPRITPKSSKSIFTDEILNALPSNSDIKRGVNNAEMANDPEWKRKQKQGIRNKTSTKVWKSKQLAGVRNKRANGTWKDNVKEGAKKREQENTFDRKALNAKIIASKKWRDAVKKGMKNRWKNPDNLTKCPHCNKLCDNANYKRWHGDNCKQAPK